ncbi:hypothetical protein ANCDUO_16997, partial [Ancylostoma duodenale]
MDKERQEMIHTQRPYKYDIFLSEYALHKRSHRVRDRRKVRRRRTKVAKIRRAYALGGCLMFIWLSTHAILLYRRRNEHRSLNEKIPPMSWEEFVQDYLIPGK